MRAREHKIDNTRKSAREREKERGRERKRERKGEGVKKEKKNRA